MASVRSYVQALLRLCRWFASVRPPILSVFHTWLVACCQPNPMNPSDSELHLHTGCVWNQNQALWWFIILSLPGDRTLCGPDLFLCSGHLFLCSFVQGVFRSPYLACGSSLLISDQSIEGKIETPQRLSTEPESMDTLIG